VPLATREQLPVIDVSPLVAAHADPAATSHVAAAIQRACLDTGFFYIAGSCLPDTQGIFQAAQQLFELPSSQKQQLDASLSPLHRGYTGQGGAHNCVPAEARHVGPDNKESYLLGE
jgi:isopenicillin N synthase-like dioxygenase